MAEPPPGQPHQPAPPAGEPPEGTPAASQDHAEQWRQYYAQKSAYDQQQAEYHRQWQGYYAQVAQQQQWQQQWAAYYAQQGQQAPQQSSQQGELRGQAAYLAGQQAQEQQQQQTVAAASQGSATTQAKPAYGAYGAYGSTAATSFRNRQSPSQTPSTNVHNAQAKSSMWVPQAEDREAIRSTAQSKPHPPTLEAYVQRCFRSCSNAKEREQMEVALKKIISSLDKDQRALRDWAAEPIPTLNEKKATRWGMEPPQLNGLPNMNGWPGYAFNEDSKVGGKKNKKKGKKRGLADVDEGALTTVEIQAREQRQRRFEKMNKAPLRYKEVQRVEEIDWDNLDKYVIKGTCTDLEKKYFRLTSAPNPETVRPEAVLRQSLSLMKSKWKENPNYEYTIDQLKSIRQDMTVQHIKNDFAVDVYETNARISLENGDINNFNQCQIKVKDLYKEGLPGSHAEFAAYRIMYTAFYLNSNRGMSRLLHELGAEARKHPAVMHASAVRQAVADNNFVAFFRRLQDAPFMGAYLMDVFTTSMRTRALRTLCRAYRPTVPVDSVFERLAFEEDDELSEFLEKAGGVVKEGSDPPVIDTKASEAEFKRIDAEIEAQKSQKQF